MRERLQLTAEPSQALIDGADPFELTATLEQHIGKHLPEALTRYPGEEQMRVIRLVRNVLLTPIALEASLSMLEGIHEGQYPLTAQEVDADIERSWRHVKTESDDRIFLRSLYDLTSVHFNRALATTEERAPDALRLWQQYGARVHEATQAYLEPFLAMDPADRPPKIQEDIRNLSATPDNALDQIRLTNGTTTLLTLATLAIHQRASNNTLTGSELAISLRDNLDKAVGLTAGRRNVVTNRLCAVGDYHDPDYLAGILKEDGHYDLGVFAKHHHSPAPGSCIGYTAVRPWRDDRYDHHMELIEWLRDTTNGRDPSQPRDKMRPTEVNFYAASFIIDALLKARRPFLPGLIIRDITEQVLRRGGYRKDFTLEA